MYRFVDNFYDKYPQVAEWTAKVRAQGERYDQVTNAWGRDMIIDRYWNEERGEWSSKAWTQAPALHGQSGTTEVLYDGLIKMYHYDRRLLNWVICPIHDAILMDVPEEEVDYARRAVQECMETTINGVNFPVSSGPDGDHWYDAGHERGDNMSDDQAAISALVLTAMDVAWSDSEECSALPGLVADQLLISDWLATKKAEWQAEAWEQGAAAPRMQDGSELPAVDNPYREQA